MNISRRVRIYPDESQSRIIENTFGCVRFVWNQMLSRAIESYDIGDIQIPNLCDIVYENPFLSKDNKELIVDRHAINNTKQFLNAAFRKYFRSIKNSKRIEFRKDGRPKCFPRFKSKKRSKNSYTNYHGEQTYIDFANHFIKIPVLGKVRLNPREHVIPESWCIRHITISRSNTNKYYCSIYFHCEDDNNLEGKNFVNNPNECLNILGIDYSSSALYVDSEFNKPGYPKYYRRSMKRLRILNKRLSRRKKNSKGCEQTLKQIRVLHEKISNQRKDFLHKLSTTITKLYDVICVEDLDMRSISQCLKLGISTMDNGYGMFRKMLYYKQLRKPYHMMVVADKWFPSSKRCSNCGYINHGLTLKDRIYTCPSCGNVIDRDLNAALNLKQYGLDYINKLFIDIREFNVA